MDPISANTTIQELYDMDWISVRSYNVCKTAELYRLADIINCYKTLGSFSKIRNCGAKSNSELIELCISYINQEPQFLVLADTLSDAENPTLKKLWQSGYISIRAYNICVDSKIFTFKELKDYFHRFKTFKNLRRCGTNNDRELRNLCKKRIDIQRQTVVIQAPSEIVTYFSLSVYKKSILNKQVEFLKSKCSVRACTGIDTIAKSAIVKELLEVIFQDNFEFKKIRNIGIGTIKELEHFRTEVSKFIYFLEATPEDHLVHQYTKLTLRTLFEINSEGFEGKVENAFDTSGRIKLFCLIQILLEEGAILSNSEKLVFQFTFQENNQLTLQEIGKRLDLSRERVRQISNHFLKNFTQYFGFIKNFNLEEIVSYDWNDKYSLIIIDPDMVSRINTAEGVKYNLPFYSFLFSNLLSPNHCLFGAGSLLKGKRRTKKNRFYKAHYLIPSNLYHIYNFEGIIDDIHKKLREKIADSYEIHFEGYIFGFYKEEDVSQLQTIKEIVQRILFDEFNVAPDVRGYIVFERNKRKTIADYILMVLKNEGTSLSVNDIFTKVIALNEIEVTPLSIRLAVQKEKSLFLNIRSNNTYGLLEWGNEADKLKGKTIKEIVHNYLESKTCPSHVFEIAKHINSHYPTTVRSIMTNLKNNNKGRFVFFEAGFIGLPSKNYSDCQTNYKKIQGTRFTKLAFFNLSGWNVEAAINHLCDKYDYLPIQIEHIIDTNVKAKVISITKDNKIKYEPNNKN